MSYLIYEMKYWMWRLFGLGRKKVDGRITAIKGIDPKSSKYAYFREPTVGEVQDYFRIVEGYKKDDLMNNAYILTNFLCDKDGRLITKREVKSLYLDDMQIIVGFIDAMLIGRLGFSDVEEAKETSEKKS